MLRTSSSVLSAGSSDVSGTPDTDENLGSGSMFSPCSPITRALIESREWPVASCMNWRNLDRSSIPPMPSTLLRSSPDALYATYAMGSSGFVTGTRTAPGACRPTLPATSLTIPELIFR